MKIIINITLVFKYICKHICKHICKYICKYLCPTFPAYVTAAGDFSIVWCSVVTYTVTRATRTYQNRQVFNTGNGISIHSINTEIGNKTFYSVTGFVNVSLPRLRDTTFYVHLYCKVFGFMAKSCFLNIKHNHVCFLKCDNSLNVDCHPRSILSIIHRCQDLTYTKE